MHVDNVGDTPQTTGRFSGEFADYMPTFSPCGLRSGYAYCRGNGPAQGEQEFWIPAEGARDYYARQCALGARATYRSVPGEHLLADALGYPEAAAWLGQRLQGIPAPGGC